VISGRAPTPAREQRLAVLEPVSGDFVYVNAGHDAPMLVRRGAQSIERLMPTGAALGLMPDQAFGVAAGRLAPGDLLLAFTDGVTEAGSQGVLFGEQGIEDRLRAMNGSADELLGEIAAGVAALNVEQADDVTMLAAQRALRLSQAGGAPVR